MVLKISGRIWKSEYADLSPEIRCFNIIKKVNSEYIEVDDLKPILNSTLILINILHISPPGDPPRSRVLESNSRIPREIC